MPSVSATTPSPGERGVAVDQDAGAPASRSSVVHVVLRRRGPCPRPPGPPPPGGWGSTPSSTGIVVPVRGCVNLPVGAEVVLHVARALRRLSGSMSPSNSRKICAVALADDVRQHVQAAAVGHAHDTARPSRRRPPSRAATSSIGIRLSAPSRLKRLWPTYFECRNRSNASAAFSRSQDVALVLRRALAADALDALLDPLLLLGLLDVHVLDRRRSGSTRRAGGRGSRGAVRSARPGEVVDEELAVEVPHGEPVVAGSSSGWVQDVARPERVQVREQVAPDPVHVDQPQHAAPASRCSLPPRLEPRVAVRRSTARARTGRRGSRRSPS